MKNGVIVAPLQKRLRESDSWMKRPDVRLLFLFWKRKYKVLRMHFYVMGNQHGARISHAIYFTLVCSWSRERTHTRRKFIIGMNDIVVRGSAVCSSRRRRRWEIEARCKHTGGTRTRMRCESYPQLYLHNHKQFARCMWYGDRNLEHCIIVSTELYVKKNSHQFVMYGSGSGMHIILRR